MPTHQPGKGVTWGLTRGLFLVLTLVFFIIPGVSAETPISNSAVKMPVFLLIAGISLILLIIGLGANIPFFTIVGFFLIGVMGFIIQAGNLYVPMGDTYETYQYGNNFTDQNWDYDTGTAPEGPQNQTYLFQKNETMLYEPWDNGNYHFIGFFVMFVGFIASFFSVFATFGGGAD